jgi:hypothetical protein
MLLAERSKGGIVRAGKNLITNAMKSCPAFSQQTVMTVM